MRSRVCKLGQLVVASCAVAACGAEEMPAGPGRVDAPVGSCSDLTRLLARYDGNEIEVCGPPEGEFRELIAIGRGNFVARNLISGIIELWGTAPDGGFGGGPLAGSVWGNSPRTTLVISLGGDRALAYDQRTGRRQIYQVNPTARLWSNPLAPALTDGSWPPIVSGRDLLSLDAEHVLDWQPGTGDFNVWRFDRANELTNPFVPTEFRGNREVFLRGHRLIALGNDLLLDWFPLTGAYRVWSFTWQSGSGDPFAMNPVAQGTWTSPGPDHEIMLIDTGKLMIWNRRTGELEVRAFVPPPGDPLGGATLVRETNERLRSLPRLWAAPTQSAIRRAVIIVQRGRSFDHHFGRYCQAPAGSSPACRPGEGAACCEAMPESTPGAAACRPVDSTIDDHVPNDGPQCLTEKINGGAMDRFAASSLAGCGDPRDFACVMPDTAEAMGVYHRFARQGAIADRFFQIVGPPELNVIYLAKAGLGSVVPADPKEALEMQAGEAITSLIANRHTSWALYLGDPATDTYMQTIPNYYDARWSHFRWLAELHRDIREQQLGSISVVIPPLPLSELAGHGPPRAGAELVGGIADAIAASPYRDDTLVLIVHATAGGFYDHVPPPPTLPRLYDPSGLPYGPRVAAVALGRFARPNHVSHVQMELSSVTKFLEWNWLGGVTGQLGGRDTVVNNIGNLLDPAATVTPVP